MILFFCIACNTYFWWLFERTLTNLLAAERGIKPEKFFYFRRKPTGN